MHRYVARTCTGFAAAGALVGGAQAVETEQILLGELLVEGIHQNNYLDGSDDRNDRASQMWLRAKLGAKVDFDQFAEVEVAVVYDGEGGDATGDNDNDSQVELNDAYITLKRLFRDDFHMRLGRQPVAYNLRPDYGAFLHDSRANKPTVTSWDGVRAYYQNVRWTITAFWFMLDEANERQGLQPTNAADRSNADDNDLWGVVVDYQPDADADNRVFITGSATWEKKPGAGAFGESPAGRDLITYYLGAEADLGEGFQLYGEGAIQEGETESGHDYAGWGFNLGFDYHVPGPIDTVVGIQYDWLTGDDPGSSEFEGFVANWEGVSDALIVEHERYGELSEMLAGNLQALKLKLEYRFLEDRFRIKMLGAHYTLDEEVGGEDDFGTEIDFTMNWQYTYWVNLGFMAAAFIPGKGYQEVANGIYGNDAGDDEIYFFGGSAQIVY